MNEFVSDLHAYFYLNPWEKEHLEPNKTDLHSFATQMYPNRDATTIGRKPSEVK